MVRSSAKIASPRLTMLLKQLWYLSLLVLIVLNTVTCVDPFDLGVTGDQPSLVIEGQIHNGQGPYRVRMLRSVDLINSTPEISAAVNVSDDLGNQFVFTETVPGTYESDLSFQAAVGRTYTLNVQTNNGEEYRSTPQTILAPITMDSIYLRAAERLVISDLGNEVTVRGFNVLVDTKSDGQGPSYFRWDYRGVFSLVTPDPCAFGCPGICFAMEQPSEFLKVFSTTENNVPISEISMGFFTPTIEFETSYRIFIRQFRLNQEAFDFWEAVENQRTNTGSIFDAPPGIIVGNVTSLDDFKRTTL